MIKNAIRAVLFGLAIATMSAPALAWDNSVPDVIKSPKNSIRDIVVAIDNSLAGGARVMYVVPTSYDLYMTKICSTLLSSSSNKVVRVFNTPPGESAALLFTNSNGTHCMDFEANPVLMPPGTQFSIDTDLLSGAVIYNNTAMWGILIPKDPSNWQ